MCSKHLVGVLDPGPWVGYNQARPHLGTKELDQAARPGLVCGQMVSYTWAFFFLNLWMQIKVGVMAIFKNSVS